MELVLVRHGKAEAAGMREHDVDRRLTPDGREQIRAAAAGLARFVDAGAGVSLWNSTAERAMETAGLIADAFGGRLEPEPREVILAGDFDALSRAWAGFPRDATLVVVGHEPYLSHWIALMTGAIIPLKPGAMAAIHLEHAAVPRGTLRWFAHPEALARLG